MYIYVLYNCANFLQIFSVFNFMEINSYLIVLFIAHDNEWVTEIYFIFRDMNKQSIANIHSKISQLHFNSILRSEWNAKDYFLENGRFALAKNSIYIWCKFFWWFFFSEPPKPKTIFLANLIDFVAFDLRFVYFNFLEVEHIVYRTND